MLSNRKRPVWPAVFSVLLAFHVLLVYGLPAGIVLLLAILFGFLFYRVGPLGSVTVALTLLAATALFGIALKLSGLEDAIYFRPDEKLSVFDPERGHRLFVKNSRIEMQMPHGDLQSMTREKMSEPHRVVFQTDSYGFRNGADYQGQKYLLIGDSFVVGSSNSQEDILSAQLDRDYGIRAYNLAHPGGLPDYAQYLAAFRAVHRNGYKVLLFVFEGNDFEDEVNKQRTGPSRWLNDYFNMFSGTNVYRFTKSLYKRSTRANGITNSQYTTTAEIAGRKLAFLTRYVEVTKRATVPQLAAFDRALQEMSGDIERVFFIPTKYRVYQKYLSPGEKLPSAQWDYLNSLCQRLGLHCTDLTAPLQLASDRLLAKGEMTWWRDDSHWNPQGIAAAARAVADSLSRGGAGRGREKRE